MSVAPRLLRRVSQRLSLTSLPPASRETVCLQCRLLATRQSLHTYRRRPVPVPHIRYNARLGQKRTWMEVIGTEIARSMIKPIDNTPQNPGIGVIGALVQFIDSEIGFEPTTSELVKAFELIARDPSIHYILKDNGNCYGVIRLLETLSLREDLSLVKDGDIIKVLKGLETIDTDMGVTLAGILLDYIRRTRGDNTDLLRAGFEAVVATLTNTGDFLKAIGFLKAGAEGYGAEVIQSKPWWHLLDRVIATDNEEILLLLSESPEAKDPNHLGEFGILHGLLRFYLDREDTANAKKWWETMKPAATSITCKMIFGYGVGHPDDKLAQSWTQQMFDELDTFQPDTEDGSPEMELEEGELTPAEDLEIMKAKWRMTQGENIHDIATTLQQISPSLKVEMVNELVDFAIWRKDTDSAKFMLMLATQSRVHLNRRSQILQIRLGMLLNDANAAMAAWEGLKYYDDSHDSDGETLELLKLMASNVQTESYVIEQLYAEVLRRKLQIDASTLSLLFQWSLKKSTFVRVVEMISREIVNYTPDDRLKIMKAIGEAIGHPDADLLSTWKLYQALRDLFPELPLSVRRDVMEAFFHRDAPELAGVVFMQMRHSSNAMPDLDTYIAAFRHCARLQDYPRTWEIHLQLKIDPNVKPTTELYNSIIWAYNSCNHPNPAFDVFRVITNSRQGPNNDTLSLIMTTCGLGKAPAMKRRSDIIWNNFKKLGIVPTMNNHGARIAAWCLADLYEEAFKQFREMEATEGVRPDREVFMALYAEYHPDRRPQLEKWTAKHLPEVWEEIMNDPSQPLKQYEGERPVWFKNGPPGIF
ncbi:hypothetical protein TWF696_000906 [Orbilia brochopaga]|uniref:Uncharacterized protein n=1 Tax=Orbilia brochopaga TaxID=3140254 RepID=A0AAV9VG88_9PEZI